MTLWREDFKAALAQLGERQTEDLKAPCSIHGGGTIFRQYFFSFSTESLNSLEYEFEKNEKFTDMEIPVLKHSEIRDLCVYYGHV